LGFLGKANQGLNVVVDSHIRSKKRRFATAVRYEPDGLHPTRFINIRDHDARAVTSQPPRRGPSAPLPTRAGNDGNFVFEMHRSLHFGPRFVARLLSNPRLVAATSRTLT
jgi:hypothetical protein